MCLKSCLKSLPLPLSHPSSCSTSGHTHFPFHHLVLSCPFSCCLYSFSHLSLCAFCLLGHTSGYLQREIPLDRQKRKCEIKGNQTGRGRSESFVLCFILFFCQHYCYSFNFLVQQKVVGPEKNPFLNFYVMYIY